MADEQSLTAIQPPKPTRRRKTAQKTAAAPTDAKQRRKALKHSMDLLLALPVANTADFNKAAEMGIPAEEINNSQLLVLALFNRAKDGDLAAFKELRSLIGEAGDKTDEHTLNEAKKILGDVKSGF